jgi:adenylate kinase
MTVQDENDRAAWLRGPSAKCSLLPQGVERPWHLVLLGAPGVGKGTQAAFFGERLRGCHLSTGDLFRAAANIPEHRRSYAMAEAVQHMRHGELVPDSTVWEIVRERAGCIRCPGGFVLDGFPRTRPQAEAFQLLLKEEGICLDAVLNYELPAPEIILRLSGRRICEKCKAIFHLSQIPQNMNGNCPKCGGSLVQREDDRPESIMLRLETYIRDTAPLIDFYRSANLLVSVSAAGSPNEVFARSVAALETAMTDGLLRSRNPHDAAMGVHARRKGARMESEPL